LQALLDVRELSKVFVLHGLGAKQIVGCRNVSFQVEPGMFLAITGMSGAGKSTVIKCIYRSYVPTSGQILYQSGEAEFDLATLDDRGVLQIRRRDIGYVSQFLRVVPRVSALDVVGESLMLEGAEPAEARRQAGVLLARLRLPEEIWDAFPANFSGGEKQRVNVARACLAKPRLLLVDEPTASLDPGTKRDVVDLLHDLKRENVTIVATLHDQEVVQLLADEELRMEGGTICAAAS
jgi:alpha-D-ribose 1-methylphosphonate 5-triphosphate synthase subunit PhnL